MRLPEIKIKIGYIYDAVNECMEHLPGELEEFIGLGLVKDGMYKKIEFAIQNVIDICSIIHADLNLGVPESEDDILNGLEKNNVLSSEVISIIKGMKGFRNILVHRYGEIDDVKAFDNLEEGKGDFEKVIREIESFLKKAHENRKK